MKAGRPKGYQKGNERKIRERYICSCNPNETFHSKTGRCNKCKEMCLTADAFRVKQVVDSGLNSPKQMKSSGKKQNVRKPVKLECDM